MISRTQGLGCQLLVLPAFSAVKHAHPFLRKREKDGDGSSATTEQLRERAARGPELTVGKIS